MESLGPWLRGERQKRRITLEDISRHTKIRMHYLHAIETEHLHDLPAGVIGKGFVRAYANYLGIDEQQAIAA